MQKQILIAAVLLIGLASCLRIVPIPQQFNKGNSTFQIGQISSINFEFKTQKISFDKFNSGEFIDIQTQRENDLKMFREVSSEIVSQRLPKLNVCKPKNGLNAVNLIVQVSLNNTNTKYTNYDNFKVDESYEISINNQLTVIQLKCHGYVSFLRALETLMQIIQQSYQTTHFEFDFLPLQIKDAPAFGHRGVMIDTSRHFLSLESIKNTIRALSISKFNVLHLHLTDSESFSFEMKKYPGLTTYGAYSAEEVYSQKQLKELDTFAQKYGVILIPEIDSPAHTRSWSNAPELQDIDSCRDYPKSEWGQYCNEPPCGQLDVTLQKARDVTEAIMNETAEIFSSEFLHLGGDEPNTKCWQSKPSIAQYMKEHNIANYDELQSVYRDFQRGVIEKNKLNKKRIFWLASNNVNVKTDDEAIMQFWGDESEYTELLKIKNPVILSTYTYIYLDCGQGSLVGDNSWCDPFKTWKRIYSLSVTANDAISRDRILGSEAALWTEGSNTDDYIQKVFPRVVPLSINLWNPDVQLGEIELVKHLVAIKNQISLAGIQTGTISSQYCELNVEDCFFD